VLAVTVTVTDKAKPSDRLAISVANWGGSQYATDWIEFDIAFSPASRAGTRGSPRSKATTQNRSARSSSAATAWTSSIATRPQRPGIADGKSVWEHRIIGLSSTAPGPFGKHGVVFNGGKPGTYTIYLDNLRIRHADGSTTPLWTSGKDTRTGKFTASELFKDLKIRAVSVAEAGK
jgi:hypothetical protein